MPVRDGERAGLPAEQLLRTRLVPGRLASSARKYYSQPSSITRSQLIFRFFRLMAPIDEIEAVLFRPNTEALKAAVTRQGSR